MKFSAAGGWWGKDWYERVRLGEKYGFPGVEQLGWLGLDFDLAKKTLDETGVTSTAIVIQSVKKENMEKTAWSHGMVWEDSRPAFLESFRESVEVAKKLNVPNIIATTAWTHGVGSCLMGAINGPKIKERFGIPEEDTLRLAIALGYPAHSSTIVDMPADGAFDYYVDEKRDYYVPKRAFDDVVRFA